MPSKASSYGSLASLPQDKCANDRDKLCLTPDEKREALNLLGCTSWKQIDPGNFKHNKNIKNLIFSADYYRQKFYVYLENLIRLNFLS